MSLVEGVEYFVLSGLGLFLILVTLEDLLLDLWAYWRRCRPRFLSDEHWQSMRACHEKNIAIIIANWREADVIERMIAGNLLRLEYTNYCFVIGVYPNDIETMAAAQRAQSLFPERVRVVVNVYPGPTSKGQLLNQIVAQVFEWEQLKLDTFFARGIDLILMHDSEDIIHPRSLKILNEASDDADFLQMPIFSFQRHWRDWVGATYQDEFSELHIKDLLVRESLGAPVPSAGVGTCLSRRLVLALRKKQKGLFLREDSLTEDYVLGMTAHSLGFKTQFLCYYFVNAKEQRELVATREYFPSHFFAALRQKSRWITGIALQSWSMVPWTGGAAHKLFLWRDRRGPLVNLCSLILVLVSFYFFFLMFSEKPLPQFAQSTLFGVFSGLLMIGFVSRIAHRAWALRFVYGPLEWVKFPWRWIVGIIINVGASGRAVAQFVHSRWTGQTLKWVKTQHTLPEEFGVNDESLIVAKVRVPNSTMREPQRSQDAIV